MSFSRMMSFLPMVLMTLIGTAMIGVAFFIDPGMMTDDGSMTVRNLLFLMGGSFVLIDGIILVIMLIVSSSRRRREENLLANGVQGMARIISVDDTGVFINNQPRLALQLEISLPGQSPYIAEKRMVIPMSKLGQIVPDAEIQVLVDPSDPGDPNKIGLLLR